MKIIISNAVVLNGGDAAITFGTIKALRRAFGSDLRVQVAVPNAARAALLFPELEFIEPPGQYAARYPRTRYLGRLVREVRARQLALASKVLRGGGAIPRWLIPDESIIASLEAYRDADFVVSSGGTYLRDDYGLVAQLADYRATLTLGRPLGFYTQSIGPFADASPRHPLRRIFEQSFCIMLRDGTSVEYLNRLGVAAPRPVLEPDAAFALGDDVVLARATSRDGRPEKPKVAISVREWSHFATVDSQTGMRRYVDAMAGLVRRLLADGAESVTFLSTCQGLGEYEDDSRLADRIVRAAAAERDPRVKVIRDWMRFDEVARCLESFDYAICTRMHMAILGWLAGTPSVAIAYESKMSSLFASIGMQDYVHDIESVTSPDLVASVERLRQNLPQVRRSVFPAVAALSRRASESGRALRDAFILATAREPTVVPLGA